MTTITDADPVVAAETWLQEFAGLLTRDADVSGLLAEESYWRDLLVFTGDLHTLHGREIADRLRTSQADAQAGNFTISAQHTAPRWVERVGVRTLEVFFEFDVQLGHAIGVARLVPDPADPARLLSWNLMTILDELAGHPERIGVHRPQGQADSRKFGGPNWLDRRQHDRRYADRDPQVLIVGGGQSGITLAARLGQLDVDTLVVDSNPRAGDNWRNRYHSLTLHNAVWLNDLPYIPFPPTWPVFVPKDKLANWFEHYVDAMEINFWGSTTFTGGDYDTARNRWNVRLRQADGSERILHPDHLVLAMGVSGIPYVPEVPGIDEFQGKVVHSSAYGDGTPYAGRPALVIGTGNSGHDVAQDLHSHGAQVTMVQRSSTTVVSIDPSASTVDASYLTAPTLEDSDLLGTATPYPVTITANQQTTQMVRELDRELVAGLNAIGFRTDYGEDETGWPLKFMRRGGGYYLNVGCSDLLINREIDLVQAADIDRVVSGGVRMTDGSVRAADLIVLATGYRTQQDGVRALLGDEIADRVGAVWGYDEEGEVRNMWRRTAQPGLWFSAGNFQLCRTYSKILAMQLKLALQVGKA